MIHLRIIGCIWIVSAAVSAANRTFELYLFATHQPSPFAPDAQGLGLWLPQILVEISFLLIILTGWGLFRRRRWALGAGGVLGVMSLLICIWFILTQGMQHGPEPYVAIWCGVALSLYTIFGVWRFKPSHPNHQPSVQLPSH
jgi:hypothetical protein